MAFTPKVGISACTPVSNGSLNSWQKDDQSQVGVVVVTHTGAFTQQNRTEEKSTAENCNCVKVQII